MNSIIQLHNKHKDEPVWIAGSHPSLEEFPDDFFDDKIGITLHLAHIKFPRATYRYANESDRVKWFKEHMPDYLNQENIFAYPFYNKTAPWTDRFVDRSRPNYYWLGLASYPPTGVKRKIDQVCIDKMVKQARDATNTFFGGHGTCLHGAMYAAIMMGANPINIIGCNHTTVSEKDHFGNAEDLNLKMRPGRAKYSDGKGAMMANGTRAIIEACRNIHVTVNWYKNYAETK